MELPSSLRALVDQGTFAADLSQADQGDRASVVTVRGEIDLMTVPVLWERLEAAIATPAGKVVVDLAAVGFMDSMGLSVLVRAHKRLRQDQRRFVLRAPQEAIRKLLSITGLDRALDVEP